VAGDRSVLPVAFNSWFDAAFLDHLFRSQGASWRTLYHYFVLDVPSMAWAMGYRDLTGGELARRLGVADEPHVAEDHTGITGAMLNVRIYRALRARHEAGAGVTPRALTCGRRRRRSHLESYSTVLQVAKLRRALDGPFEIRGCP